jgi:hypothetical protein
VKYIKTPEMRREKISEKMNLEKRANVADKRYYGIDEDQDEIYFSEDEWVEVDNVDNLKGDNNE